MQEVNQPTDILRLFREDLDPLERVSAFKVASEQLSEQVANLATPENVSSINDNFEITFYFNGHGDYIQAGQSLTAMNEPFITFVENAGDTEIGESGAFGFSVTNAFNIQFNGQAPALPPYLPSNSTDFGYWRDRGILSKASLLAPVDIRHYSRRLLDALMGNDYDQQFLNRSVPGIDLKEKTTEQLIEEQLRRGELVMYSNAVRELTSTKQILETLLKLLDTENGGGAFSDETSDKLRALLQKNRLKSDGKIQVAVLYGTAHHSMMHIYRNLGISCSREFPGSNDYPNTVKFAGSVLDQYFSAHPFGLDDQTKQKYARQLVLEGMLWDLVDNAYEYSYVPKDRAVMGNLWGAIHRAARNNTSVDGLEPIHADYQRNPLSVIPLLEEAGVSLVKI